MEIKILEKEMSIDEVRAYAQNWYGSMIKGAVDVEGGRVALGGDYHIEDSELLTGTGSKFENIWGFNIRFEEDENGALEFDSMVNIKPNMGNRNRNIHDEGLRKRAEEIIRRFIKFKS